MSKSCTDHFGITYPSESDMCRHYGINLTTYRKRIENEILYDIVWKREVAYIQSERVWNVSYFFEIY